MTQPVRRLGDMLNMIGVAVIFGVGVLVLMLNDRVNTEGTELRTVVRQQTKAIDAMSKNVAVSSERSLGSAVEIEGMQRVLVDILRRLDRLEQRPVIGQTPQERR